MPYFGDPVLSCVWLCHIIFRFVFPTPCVPRAWFRDHMLDLPMGQPKTELVALVFELTNGCSLPKYFN